MQVILLQKVPKLGERFDIKEVSFGYASNYLFPNKLAQTATPELIKRLETQKTQRLEEVKIKADLLAKNLESLEKVAIEIEATANEQGHLFQGLKEADILTALREQAHIELEPNMIVLKAPIKESGDYTIAVQSGDVSWSFKLSVKGKV